MGNTKKPDTAKIRATKKAGLSKTVATKGLLKGKK